MLVNLFNHVMDVESEAVITEEFKDISNNDMHIIEAVGISDPKNMSEIAKKLNVTVGTLTTNMNGLEKKGYKTVSKRTLQQDLCDMELSPYNARFVRMKDGHKTVYRYAESFSGIKIYEISDEEKDRIDGAISVLERFDGTPQYDWVRFCLQQIVSDEFMSDNRSLISFQNNPDLYGIEHFETLLKAIAKKQL